MLDGRLVDTLPYVGIAFTTHNKIPTFDHSVVTDQLIRIYTVFHPVTMMLPVRCSKIPQ